MPPTPPPLQAKPMTRERRLRLRSSLVLKMALLAHRMIFWRRNLQLSSVQRTRRGCSSIPRMVPMRQLLIKIYLRGTRKPPIIQPLQTMNLTMRPSCRLRLPSLLTSQLSKPSSMSKIPFKTTCTWPKLIDQSSSAKLQQTVFRSICMGTSLRSSQFHRSMAPTISTSFIHKSISTFISTHTYRNLLHQRLRCRCSRDFEIVNGSVMGAQSSQSRSQIAWFLLRCLHPCPAAYSFRVAHIPEAEIRLILCNAATNVGAFLQGVHQALDISVLKFLT